MRSGEHWCWNQSCYTIVMHATAPTAGAAWQAGLLEEKNRLLEEKDAYASKLEQSLLALRSRPSMAACRPAAAPVGGTVAGGSPGAPADGKPPAEHAELAAVSPLGGLTLTAVAAAAAAGGQQQHRRRPGSAQHGGRGCSPRPASPPDDWLSYYLGSPTSSARPGSASLRRPGSSCRRGCGGLLVPQHGAEQQGLSRDSVAMQLAPVLENLALEQQEQLRPESGAGEVPPRLSPAPNNPLFSLAAQEAAAASPVRYHCAAGGFAGGGSPGASSPGGWVAASPECLASSLTFLHQNTLYQRSPSPAQRAQHSFSGEARISSGACSPRIAAQPAGMQQQGAAERRTAAGLLSPADSRPPSPGGGKWAAPAAGIHGRGRAVLGARDANAAAQPARPPQRSAPGSSDQGRPVLGGKPQPAQPQAAPCSPPDAELAGLETIPAEGFGCVADLLEALTPKAAAAAAAAVAPKATLKAGAGAAAAGGAPTAGSGGSGGQAAPAASLRKGQHEGQQGTGGPANRHALHRVSSSPGGTKLQALKQGRLNRAADQMMTAAPSRPSGYSAAARRAAAGGPRPPPARWLRGR